MDRAREKKKRRRGDGRSPSPRREGEFEEDGKIIENFRSKRSRRLGGRSGDWKRCLGWPTRDKAKSPC